MTTEIEKYFFKTFKIHKKEKMIPRKRLPKGIKVNIGCYRIAKLYPEITDYILIELIMMIAKKRSGGCYINLFEEENFDDFKNYILKSLIETKEDFQQQIQQLFKD